MLNITSNSLCNQLSFNNVQLNIINQNNQIWFTSAELAKALTYKTADSVTRLYNRNKDEFSKNMTMTVKLTANGISNSYRQKSVRIFSLRGAHLVAMLADTDVAKDLRKWLLDLADKEVGNTVIISKIEPCTVEVNKAGLECLIHHMIYLKKFYIERNLYNIFEALNSDIGTRTYGHIMDGGAVADILQKDLKKSSLLIQGGFINE